MGTLGRKAVWGAALALWVMIPGTTASASSGSGKVDRLLQSGSSGSPQPVIIRTKPGAGASVKNRLPNRGRSPKQHKLIPAFTAVLDGREIAALAHDPDVLSISADADVSSTAAKNDVGMGPRKRKTDNTTTTTSTSTTTPDITTTTVLKQALGIDDWFTGSTMTVALIDSGIQSSADFSGRLVGSFDFTAGRAGAAVAPSDEYGHGTHVAGLIASSGSSSNGKYAGVAPSIKILSLKVLDKKGAGKTSDVIAALEFAVANKDFYGIKIVNLSIGHPIFEPAATDPLVQAVEAAVRSGLIVVAAAGNYGTNPKTGLQGYAGIASPGNAPSAITVGAASTGGTVDRSDDRVALYSSRGPSWYDGFAKPDVLAPGSNLISNEVDGSTLANAYPYLVVKEGASRYLKLSGSSMATGVVSGLIAVMIEAHNYGASMRWEQGQSGKKNLRGPFPGAPALTSKAIKAMLQYSATPLRDANGVAYDALTQGSGEVNGQGAMILAYYADTTKSAGSFWMTGVVTPSTTFGDVETSWAQTITWGTRLVRGSSIVEINQPAWDDNLVWGTGALDDLVWGRLTEDDDNLVWGTFFDADNLVWGTHLFSGDALLDDDNLVWGTSIDWGENLVWGTNLLGTFDGDNLVWGTSLDETLDNLVWGTLDDDNLVWGTSANKVMVLGTSIGGGL
jgi:subtilisin family serine protease